MTNRIRTGLVGKKLGMTNFFTESGEVLGVTLIELLDNYVFDCKKLENTDYSKVVIAFDELPENKIKKSSTKLSTDAGQKFFRHLKEFRVATDQLPEKGKKLSPNHFRDGQVVDITGISIGKGFAGSMKRHNFSGLKATHGVSISHRSHGSTGQCQDPGKVFKGKKMAGHMGHKQVTAQNLRIVNIDDELGVIAVLGSIPGHKNSVVFINDAIKSFVSEDLPFPAQYIEENSVEGKDVSESSNENSNSVDENQDNKEV